MPVNPYEGALILTDAQIKNIQTTNHIPTTAVCVRTAIGGAVWIEPTAYEIIQQYKTGKLQGYEPKPVGVVFLALPTVTKPPTATSGSVPFDGFTPPDAYIPPKTPVQTQNSSKYIQVRVGVYAPPKPSQKFAEININVFPAIPVFESSSIDFNWTLELKPIPLSLQDGLLTAARRLLDGKVNSYFDQNRVGKTLLNFGQDYQSTILNWKYDEADPTQATVLVKLYQPLPPEIELFTELWITRELSPSYLDQIFVVFIPGEGLKLYLRPPNKDINTRRLDGNEVNNVTLQTLLTSGSSSKTNLQDPILQEWYVTSLEGAELNIDYTSYKNFVFYSSAVKRLRAFREKMILLEDYNTIIAEQSASIAAATSGSGLAGFTGSLAFGGYQRISEQRVDLIRSFDGYERFLYYQSGSAYSSSFSNDGGQVDQIYFLNDATWPKISGSLISVASASDSSLYSVGGSQFMPEGDYSGLVSWFDAITYIAHEYDRQNQNRLVNNLPEYVVNDEQSADFITFMDMVGHQFDVIKLYADAMPDIFDRDSDPNHGLSPDVVWNIASSFGVELPNQYAVKHLIDYTVGQTGQVSPTVYREVATETWKRFLHNQIYLLKSRGTRTALRGLLNAYGVLPTTIRIRESSTPSFYTTQSFELIEEQTNALHITTGSFVKIPYSGGSLPSIQTVQLRVASTRPTQSVIFNVDSQWGLRVQPITSSYGNFAVVNSSGATVVSSSNFEIFNGDYYSVTLQRSGSNVKLWTQRANEDGVIEDQSYGIGTLTTWVSGAFLYLGSNGSTWGTTFSGSVDEFRMWTEVLTTGTIDFGVKYPGLYNGNTTSSARDNLPVRLSFNKPRNLGSSTSASLHFVVNETPYVRQSTVSPLYTQFSASNFTDQPTWPYSMDVVVRNVLRYAPNAGGSQFVSNKITIADPPVLRYLSDNSGSGVPVLSHEKSIVTVDQKLDAVRSTNTVGFYFSPTDAVNDSIIRSIGNIDLQDLIGSPSDQYSSSYSTLKNLNDLYWTYYAYTYNYNTFVDFVENLLQPIFKQAKNLVPARTKLLTGIVLESPMLERNKIKWNKLDLSGRGTHNEDVTPTFYPDALTTQPNAIDTEYAVRETIIDNSIVNPLDADFATKEAALDLSQNVPIDAEKSWYEVTYDLEQTNVIDAEYPSYDTSISTITANEENINTEVVFYDDETARLDYVKYLLRRFRAVSVIQIHANDKPYFTQLLQTFKPGSSIVIPTGMNPVLNPNLIIDVVSPVVDFGNISSTTYFMQRDGVYLVDGQQEVRVGQAILTAAGTWTKGNIYTQNQFVTQSNQTGSAALGNDFEYVCITPLASGSFISYNPPSLDTTNWRKMTYTYIPSKEVRIATNISGSIELVNSGSAYQPFMGYHRSHYRFYRDTRLGTLRRIWYGCKQSDTTTSDGGAAVEIIPSAGDILVVATGAEPIQRTNDNTGPILDVR